MSCLWVSRAKNVWEDVVWLSSDIGIEVFVALPAQLRQNSGFFPDQSQDWLVYKCHRFNCHPWGDFSLDKLKKLT